MNQRRIETERVVYDLFECIGFYILTEESFGNGISYFLEAVVKGLASDKGLFMPVYLYCNISFFLKLTSKPVDKYTNLVNSFTCLLVYFLFFTK